MLKKIVKLFSLKDFLRVNLFFQAVVVGVIAGFLVVCFKQTVEASFAWVQQSVLTLETAKKLFFLPFVTTLGGAFAGWLVFGFASETSGSGIPYIKAVLMRVGLMVRLRSIIVKFLAGVAGIGTGMPLGREGPSVQLGAGAGALTAKLFNLQGTHAECLIAAGSGAALGAVFNAPIAATIFVFEELLHRFSAVMLFPVLVATVTASSVMRWLLGNHPSFEVPFLSGTVGVQSLVVCLFLGLVCGAAGVLFSGLILYFRGFFSRLKTLPQWMKPAFAGFVVGCIGLLMPLALGAGNQSIELILYHHLSLDVIVILFVVRFFLTPFCFGSGTAGGIFLPMLMLGAFLGYLSALGADMLGAEVNYVVIALSGMAAFMTAVARTPITAVVMVFEMTGGYGYILPIMLATAAADLVAARFGCGPIYTLLQRKYLQQAPKAQKLSKIKVVDVMKECEMFLLEMMPLNKVKKIFYTYKAEIFPVIDSHKQLVGCLRLQNLENALIEKQKHALLVRDIMDPVPLRVYLEASLYDVYFQMVEEDQDFAFIVDENLVLQGFLYRQDIVQFVL